MLDPRVEAAPDYLRTIGGRLVAGRDLVAADVGTDNVLIDDRLAAALFDGPATGRRFQYRENGRWYTVVGVFGHMRMLGLDNRSAPYSVIQPLGPEAFAGFMSIGVRLAGELAAVTPAIRAVVHDLDPALPILRFTTARAELAASIEQQRFLAGVMLPLSAVALFLAAIGVHGVLAYAVTQRRREMGIRLAIGATPASVRSLFVRRTLLIALAGTAVGAAAALWLAGLIRALLYGVEVLDPLSIGLAAVAVVGSALLAGGLPARQATASDPLEILRSE